MSLSQVEQLRGWLKQYPEYSIRVDGNGFTIENRNKDNVGWVNFRGEAQMDLLKAVPQLEGNIGAYILHAAEWLQVGNVTEQLERYDTQLSEGDKLILKAYYPNEVDALKPLQKTNPILAVTNPENPSGSTDGSYSFLSWLLLPALALGGYFAYKKWGK